MERSHRRADMQGGGVALWQGLLLQVLLILAAPLACRSQSDAELLLGFKGTFTNGEQLLATWNDSAALCPYAGEYKSNWTGVTCQDNRVKKVELGALGLDGTIPPTGWALPDSLLTLMLGDNEIKGTITNWRLPANLEGMWLYTNLLSGSVAAPFTELPGRMNHLNLAGNDLTGTLPGDWVLPERLEQLYLTDNLFTGPIPKAWETQLPRRMSWLVISSNDLTGTLPPNWDFPPDLQNLLLGKNKLAGPLPEWPLLPSSIGQLELSNNQLTGTLPVWSTLTNNSRVWLGGNPGLCGQVPQVSYLYVGLGPLPNCSAVPNTSPSPPPSPSTSPSPPSEGPQPSSAYGAYAAPAPQPAPGPSDPANAGASGGSGSSNTGVIVGVVVGVVCVVGFAALAGWCLWRRRRQRQQSPPSQEQLEDKGATVLDDHNDKGSADGTDDLEKAAPKAAGLLASDIAPVKADHAAASAPSLLASDPLISSIVSKLGSAASSRSSLRGPSDRSRPDINISQWIIAFRDIELVKEIGKGAFGTVYLGRWNEIDVAVKLLLGAAASITNPAAAADVLLSESNPALKHLQEEAGILASLRHPHVLGFLGACLVPPCVVSEYCARGSVYDLLREAKTSPALQRRLDWPRRLQMASDAAKGMLYLHTRPQPVVHRDLKSPNLLVSKNWSVKVSDFNMSRIMEEDNVAASSTTAVSNPRWLAPEVLAGERPTLASDVFSYAIVMWELLTWEVPYINITNPWQVARLVMDGGRLEVPAADQVAGGPLGCMDGYVALMRRCWAQDPQQRPSFAEIVAELRRLSAMISREGGHLEQAAGSGNIVPGAEGHDTAERAGAPLQDSAFDQGGGAAP